MANDPVFTLTAHPPERRARSGPVTLCSGCCCCCCLHSVGSLIGAAAASIPWYNWKEDAKEPSAAPLYWSIFGVLAVLLVVVSIFGGAYVPVMLMPLLQLGVSLVALLIICFSSTDGKRPRLWSLARITAFSLVGAALGLVAIVAAGFLAVWLKL